MSTESSDDATIGAEGEAAEPASSTERGIGDVLGEETTQQYIKFNAGVFLAIGAGFALALLLLDAFGSSSGAAGGEVLFFGFVVSILFAPVIAGVTGVITSLRLDDEEKVVGVTAAAGAFVGYVALLILVIILGSLIGPSGTDLGSLVTDELLGFIGFGVGVAVAGGAAAVVTERFA